MPKATNMNKTKLKETNVNILFELNDIITNKVNGFFDMQGLKIEHLDDSGNQKYQVLKCTATDLNWTKPHKHDNSIEYFIVLEGKLEVKIGEDSTFLKEGKNITVEINKIHKVRALSENTIFLAVLVPAESEYMNE